MYNTAISPLAASAGVDNAQLLIDPLAQHLFFALLRENYSRRGSFSRSEPL
jgi:2-dehydropantoate 2-reductase